MLETGELSPCAGAGGGDQLMELGIMGKRWRLGWRGKAVAEAAPAAAAAAAAAAVVMAAAVAAVAAFVVAVVAVAVGVVLAERDGVATGARGVPAGPFARGDAPGTATARGVPHSFRPCVGMQEGRCGRSGQLLCLDSTDEAWEWCRWERE